MGENFDFDDEQEMRRRLRLSDLYLSNTATWCRTCRSERPHGRGRYLRARTLIGGMGHLLVVFERKRQSRIVA
jgi:hypothetical protein